MISYRVQSSPLATPGTVFVMVDYGHPETPMMSFGWGPAGLTAEPAETPDGRVIVCHPADEQRLRDLIARLGVARCPVKREDGARP
jgi:hypothetical protein